MPVITQDSPTVIIVLVTQKEALDDMDAHISAFNRYENIEFQHAQHVNHRLNVKFTVNNS